MKKSIFLFFAAILCAIGMNAETYRYSGEKDGWAGTQMTVSSDGYYSYYGPVTGAHQFKIGTSSNQWAYNHSYVSKGFNNTDIKDIGDWGSDNCYTWTSATHYILVYYPNTTINTTNKVKICASTVLPNDAVSEPEPEPDPEPEPEPEPEPVADVTVHFINSVEWAAVACHHWVDGGSGTSWPGDVLSKTDEIAGYDVYTATFTGAHTSCIFNNNNKGNQTSDLTVEDGKYYEVNTNTWYADKAAAEAALATPIPDETVYLINTGNWSKAMIHTWNGVGGTAWPGVEMTLTGETIEGYAVYSYTAKQGGQANLLFQESENVNKTGDLTWEAGKYYAPSKNEWYADAAAAEAALATPDVITYVLMGVGSDWTTGIALTKNETAEYEEYVLLGQEIAEGDAVKVVTLSDGVAIAWCGNVDEFSVEHTADDMGNILLAAGKYDFYYKVAEDLIYIGATTASVDNVVVAGKKATKMIIDGQIVVVRDGIKFNMLGQEVK